MTDVEVAVAGLMLAARAVGLGSVFVGIFDEKQVGSVGQKRRKTALHLHR